MGRQSPITILAISCFVAIYFAHSAVAQFDCHAREYRCHSGHCIREDQRCDGYLHCPDGDDEQHCSETECKRNEFRCNDKITCIHVDQKCDGIKDCPSGNDEQDCASVDPRLKYFCPDGKFTCRDLSCISIIGRCDGKVDCPNDRSDEEDCPCLYNKWQCDDGTCISAELKCNGNIDCPNDISDERNCDEEYECRRDEFRCDSGQCIDKRLQCNYIYDCSDYTDERDCSYRPTTTRMPDKRKCTPDEYECSNGDCIHRSAVCDRHADCAHGEDEAQCHCPEYEFKCLRGGGCIPQSLRCDRVYHCYDGSDEDGCHHHQKNNTHHQNASTSCLINQYQCADGICIAEYKRCNGINDCSDHSDELHCPTTANYDYDDDSYGEVDTSKCAHDEFECDSSMCIKINQRCDGFSDCTDETDEKNCPNTEDGCERDEFQCDGGLCLPNTVRCDGHRHCLDGTDEKNCTQCKINTFHCRNGECISDQLHCNDHRDCQDGSDEEDCNNIAQGCSPHEFTCSNGQCLSRDYVCDGRMDCTDGSDEEHCDHLHPGHDHRRPCRDDEWQCEDRKCINRHYLCDGTPDCDDGSDESRKTCASAPGGGRITPDDCSYEEYFCDDACHPSSIVCNGRIDCLDRKDEENCADNTPTPPTYPYHCPELTCPGTGKCYRFSEKCDSIHDCDDGHDESDCPCKENEFSCYDHQLCINVTLRCDGYYDCKDFSDEQNCFGCHEGQFKCHDGTCVDRSDVCNGRHDCPDGSDEANCQPSARCQPHQFQCLNGQCVNQNARCDGRPDCSDYSDERDCFLDGRACPPNMFRCENGPCIPDAFRCNGHIDCPFDSSDELDCLPTATTQPTQSRPPSPSDPQLNLKTYPNAQTIKERREVVFQCRDEGPTRAKVHWTRPNGRQLPHGFTDINGRLEIPNIRLEDAGEYICEAVDYSTHTYGQRVTVHLTVEKYNVFLDRPPSACDYHQATCMNGECISKSQICDGLPHCSDGSDEHGCSHGHGCNPDQFLCKNSKCVDRVWRCDGENDCGDNSDEESCDPNPTGSPCRYDEFQCRNGQCIPKSFHCDSTNDCQDGSDEVGCVAPVVLQPPVPRVDLTVGSVLNISCRATGVPSPLIVWRLNWGHVPQKCDSTSNDGYGTLTCRNMEVRDSGAYSCEIINTKGRIFVTPDTIVTVLSDEPDVCPSGFFNALAHRKDDCINCFCFGVSNKCKSADLFIYALPPPVTSQNVVGVDIPQSGYGDIRIGEYSGHNLISLRHGVQFRASDIPYTPELPYLTLPDYQGSQLKSYGGYLKYEAMYIGSGRPNNAPDVIIVGSGYSLTHRTQTNIQPNIRNPISVPFTPGSWFKSDGRQASREEIMMALVNLDHVLLKLQYTDATEREIELLHITMDSAAVDDRGLGSASLVEQCQCPPGYSGFSCETCAPGHVRQKGGAWLGNCVPEPTETCHHGTYGDPSRGIPCRRCPCPLPNTENNFAHSCSLGADNDVICHCQRGYTGRRCEQCEPGYHGDPMQPGSRCSLIPVQHCNEYGTLRTRSDGTCECKQNVVGLYCDQCVPNSFHLNEYSYTGCHDCFCMGITKQCSSSDWYRDIVTSRFNGGRAEHGFTLISNYERPTPAGLYVQQRENELTFQGRSDDTAVHYWSLPNKFLGDKINAYGGVLNYTIRYNPLPGGLMSRNNAPDVVIKSANNIVILHHRKGEVLPSGSQSNSIPMIEQAWQSSDGRTINREQLLMALADINAIYLKATYTTVTAEAAISYVSLDTATPSNIGTSRAVEVEQCLCPQGYTGLSCEDCSPGYKRSGSGPNLGYCEPCECFNHSDECDSDTGHCLNCRDNTAGTYCDLCAPGFTGNATYGTTRDCNYAESQGRCDNCDFRGTASCDNRICRCKANVVGDRCDQCRPNTYNLQELSHVGCTECFCSGVTTECYQSHYSREQIPIFVFEDKLTLTNYDGVTQIEEGFEIDIAANEVSHKFNAYSTYYWRLPQRFLGNQVKSYGGNLLFTVETEGYGEYINDQDVILRGNGITLAWARKPGTEKDITVTARLHESDKWSKIERAGLQPATHTDFLTVLSNLDHILIRANNKSPTRLTKIRDIVLDTALETPIPGKAIATDVEVCQCPHGYSGSSCESCAPMFYHDTFDRHGILGSCKPCPCQENGESCHQQSNGHVLCTCRIGYTGDHCEYADRPTDRPPIPTPYPPEVTITVTVSSPSIRIVEIGETISLDCSAHVILTHVPIQVRWFKLNGQLPEMGYEDQGRLHIQNIQVHDAGIYVCQATRGDEIAQQNVTIHVGRPQVPDVIVSPSYIDAEEYNSAEFFCEGMGSPQPYITWSRVGGPLPPSAVVDGPRLTFTSLRRSDEGTYRCLAQNNVGDRDAIVQVVVRPSRVTPTTEYPVPTFAPVPGEVEIEPPYYQGRSGSDVHLNCNYDTRESVEYRWLKDNNVLYGEHIKTYNNLLVIQRASSRDSGQYTCQVVNVRTGYILSGTSTVYIEGGESSERPPQVIPLKNAHSVVQGHDLSIVCEASGSPYPTIKWTKLHENLDSNIRITGNTLLISNAQAANRGVYVCIAESVSGSDQSSTVVDVDPRERPMLEVHPRDPQFVRVGDSAMLSCRAIAGIPEPIITWVRRDGRPLSPRVHEEYRGIISFHDVTAEDAGEYECRAENIAGHVTATAILNIQQSPEIIVIPEKEEIVLTEGDELKLVCMGVGQPAPQVHWDYDQRGAVARYPTYSPEAIIHIYEVRKQDQRVYTCKATSAAGSLQKRVSVIVNSKRGDIGPHDGDSPNLQPYKVGLGDSATLICQIDDSQVRTVWNRIDGRPLPHNAVISGNNLIIENTDWDAAGLYQCSVIDRYGQRPLITAEIQVLPIPRITFSPPMPMVVRSGENVVIYCNATGEEPIRVNWHAENHRPLPHSVSAESNYLRFNYITPADAGRYYCTALNAHGNATKVAEVLVNRGTQVDRPSQSRVHEVFEGDNVALDCGIPQERFEAGFRYNWRRSQGPISPNADFNYNRLILRNIRPEDGGRYICELISPTSGVLSSNYVEVVIKRRRPKYEVYCMVFHFCPGLEPIIRPTCLDTDFRCISHPHTCIRQKMVCDGMHDCLDHSDELNCSQSINQPFMKRWKKDRQPNKIIANLEVGGGHHHLQPVLTLHPSQSYIRTGESVEVDCSPSDNNYANVVWERSDGSRLPSNVRQIGNKLVITNAQPSDSGDYVCRCVTDLGQEYSSSYELNIEEEAYKRPPRHHKVERAEVGSNVILRCDADHYPASFQWSRQHGKFDSGQVLTTSELRLLNVQASDAGTYICSVSHNAKTVDVPTTLVVTGTIPYFKQNPKSYMTFPKLEGAYMKFNFEVTFRPETLDGLILYNGQKKGSGDYIALSLHDGYPEFRFDFGNNVTIIRSEEPITLGEWHTVKVNRVRKEGFMIVDNQRPVAFPPTQQFIGLDLIENMYIGGVPRWEDIPSTAVAHQIGFIGCVSRLILKDQVVELNRDAIFKEGTTACKPCEGDPCQNDGVCLETQTEMGYSCICQDGFTGKNCAVQGSSCMPGICGVGRCENADFGMECFCPLNKTGNRCQYVEHLDGGSLSFKDGSYAAYKTPKASKLNIKFQIRPDNTEDSVIMYVAESENANGDFAAVLIKDKHVELRLNTGARLKPLVIRSQNPIEAHKWTEIHVSRKLGEGNLKVGDELEQTGKAVGPARSMYLKTYLYLGGYDKRILLNKGVEVTRGFEGCISGLEESSQPVNMVAEILDAANVQSCGDVNEIIQKPHDEYPLSAPCAQDPCENGGTCVPDGSSHRCDCPLGFAGHNCENYYRLDLKAHFRGNGYLEIDHAPFSDSIDQMNSSVALLFSTSSPNGILLWYGQEKGQTYSGNDYLALAVVDGILEYSFRLDGEESSIRTPYTRVDDGHRHVAIIKRSGNHHSLELDNFTYYGESRPTNRKRMHLPGHLFIGGAPNLSNFTGNRYTQGFSGCVHVIEAQDSGPIPLGQRAISGVNVDTCPDDNSDYHDIDLGPEPPVV